MSGRESSFRLLIAGGGTGGHVFPALAVAEAVLEERSDAKIIFVGTQQGIESRLVPQAGFELRTLRIGGLKGKGILRRALTLAQLPVAVAGSARLIRSFRPDVVLGVGGYASGPVGIAAWVTGAPLALLEVNSLPGLTNRKLARRAKAAFISFAASAEKLACPTILTGNPVRPQVRALAPATSDGPFSVLILGGSQGAVGLNSLVIDALPRLQAGGMELRIVHQSGYADLERVSSAYAGSRLQARVLPFIEDMAAAYAAAEMVICRAGATTVAELAAARRPAVLVPLPTAADDHQEHNARQIVNAGGGAVLHQSGSAGPRLAELILEWYDRRSKLAAMGAALELIDRPDAARRISEELAALGRRKS